jgi:4-hydroxymandelate oxidase
VAEENVTNFAELYAKGIEKLKNAGKEWAPPGGGYGPSILANRKILHSTFFETKYLDPVEVDTSFALFGRNFKTPVFCTAISRSTYMDETTLPEIAKGIANAGAFIMHGVGGNVDLRAMIDAGAPVIKIIKPYRNPEVIYETLRNAESAGCFAVGMDIDHFHGMQRSTGEVRSTETYGPQKTEFMRQLIAQTKLPVIIKGVLSLTDAEKAVQLGASAILVSNHGSGSFQYGVPSLIALPRIAESYGSRITILVDTGFETGMDALKGLALGARGVGFGSAVTLAWAAEGAEGVSRLVRQLTAELRRTMAITGCANLAAVNRSIIVPLAHLD